MNMYFSIVLYFFRKEKETNNRDQQNFEHLSHKERIISNKKRESDRKAMEIRLGISMFNSYLQSIEQTTMYHFSHRIYISIDKVNLVFITTDMLVRFMIIEAKLFCEPDGICNVSKKCTTNIIAE
jgi:hypothetical protein